MKTNKKLRPLKKLKKLRKDAWDLQSEYRRKKYADKNGMIRCCTCGKIKHWKNMYLGHYLHNCLDFYPRNLHPQCGQCNGYKHGAPREYARFLVDSYGVDILDELQHAKTEEAENPLKRDQIEALIKFYKEEA